MPVVCSVEKCDKLAVLKRPKTGHAMCKECFFYCFETEIHFTIIHGELFKKGYKVAIGASGGKDSTVLAYVLKLLNERYDYGLDLFLLSIDEGITGYRDDSLETVKQNRDDYQLPLKILSYKDLYGWTMDEIVAQIGRTNNCTFCGVFRRQALDRGAALLGVDMIVTGHNADDIAETVIMNILRGDIARLSRCTNIVTEGEGTIPRCKPLKYAYEKEIVMYAHYKELVYFSTECIYSLNAYRGHTREYIKEIERVRPSCILDIIHSGETVQIKESIKFPERRTCTRCGFVASQEICKACVLLEGLNIGMPKLGLGKSNKAKKIMGLKVLDGSENKTKKKPTNDSRKKVKKEKKFTCGEACSSKCQSISPEPTISNENNVPLTSEENAIDEICSQDTFDHSILSISNMLFNDDNSKDEVSKINMNKATEKMKHKVPTNLRIPEDTSECTDDDISDDEFDLSAFKKLMESNYPDLAELAKQRQKKRESELVDNLTNMNMKQPSSTKTTNNFESPITDNDTNRERLSAIIIDDNSDSQLSDHKNNTDKLESASTVITKSNNIKLQSVNHSNNSSILQEQPTIVQATPKKTRPSLLLPEMMHKAKNNLEF